MNLFDVSVSEKDIRIANRVRAQVRDKYPSPLDLFADFARRDPAAYALVQHYFKDAAAQDKDMGLMVMVEACAAVWALLREIRDEVRPRESVN